MHSYTVSLYCVRVQAYPLPPLHQTAAEIRKTHGDAVDTLVCPADLGRPTDVSRLFRNLKRTYGRVDLLFNNAGAAMPPT